MREQNYNLRWNRDVLKQDSAWWIVTELDDGESYMLTCNTPAEGTSAVGGITDLSFSAHFTAQEWSEFQDLMDRNRVSRKS